MKPIWIVALLAAPLLAQQAPDFSGVYYPINPFGNFRGGPAGGGPGGGPPPARTGPPPKPTASAPLSDGSRGRTPDEPQLTPPFMAKWQEISKTRVAGSYEYDPVAKCLPPGMPAMMSMAYGMEVMQTKDKVTFFSELNDALRRVYLDGRKASQKVLDDPTYAGYSTGHWEGDTLVVDTVALRDNTFIEGFTPHSGEMTVHERIRLLEPTLLEDQITVTDPKALVKPWSTVKKYRKAKAGSGQDELREFACAEGLGEAK
ncbi:MAG TPA: hypothetical protein VFW44_10330 [Bryobacteraceae bacterium]|nr:hypothetical protein [Bryobacteraceae bacterium]